MLKMMFVFSSFERMKKTHVVAFDEELTLPSENAKIVFNYFQALDGITAYLHSYKMVAPEVPKKNLLELSSY